MRDQASTVAFEHQVRVDGDVLIYEEHTAVDIYGKRFDHVDSNTLERRPVGIRGQRPRARPRERRLVHPRSGDRSTGPNELAAPVDRFCGVETAGSARGTSTPSAGR